MKQDNMMSSGGAISSNQSFFSAADEDDFHEFDNEPEFLDAEGYFDDDLVK